MQAARIHEDLTLRLDDVDTPTPGRGEVLVRIHAAGVCGTDLHILDGMIKPDPYPMILGHEAAGAVESVGDDVSLQPGDRVAIYNKIFCGHCEQCLKGRQNICDNEADQLGFNRDGGDAEYVVVPEKNAVVMPQGVDFATAAVLTCAGMTAMHATKLSNLRVADTAVVDGIGGVGILVVQAAAHAAARVIAVADSEEKLQLARDHGASDGLLVATPEAYDDLAEGIRALTDARGTDVFFELVGTTRSMTAGIRSLAKGGRFVSTGYTDQQIEIHPIEFILPESSFISTVAATRLDLQDAMSLAASGAMNVPIAGTFPLGGVSDALDALRQRAVLGRQVLEIA
ncbi:MAG: alcohol dehydrogenase, propanol-preferring [Actinomycetota bacterium]|jgi:propanol-preferring alcohol dehydrogenase|nr:alcohol dehydrogenase, propanol-preferring [Actinomycetota bacterium]